MILRTSEVALAANGKHVVLPCAPYRPIGVAGVARVCLAHDEIVVLIIIVVVAVTADEVLDPAFVHEGIVAEIRAVVDDVVAARERGLLELVDRVDGALHAAVTEIPIIIAVRVVRIERGVVTVHIDAGIRNAVAVCVYLAVFDLFRVSGDRRRRKCGKRECERDEKRHRDERYLATDA